MTVTSPGSWRKGPKGRNLLRPGGPKAEERSEWQQQTTCAGLPAHAEGPLGLILYGSALACFVLAWVAGSAPGSFIAVAVGLLIALLAPAFRPLTGEDQGERLAVRYGPLPLFRRT